MGIKKSIKWEIIIALTTTKFSQLTLKEMCGDD